MSDQFGNNVDEEIRVPVKGWHPLGKNSWIEAPTTTVTRSGPHSRPRPVPETIKEWAIAYANGSIDEARFEDEGEARREIQNIRGVLKNYGVPEESWPVLMERTVVVDVVTSSWKFLSV